MTKSNSHKKALVIVESPAKAKTINKYLGPDFEVKASMGHVRDLPSKGLNVDIENDFEPTYDVRRAGSDFLRAVLQQQEPVPWLSEYRYVVDLEYPSSTDERGAEAAARLALELRQLLALREGLGHGLPVTPRQLRLLVEGLEVRGPTRHAEVDHALCLGSMRQEGFGTNWQAFGEFTAGGSHQF